MNLKQRKTILLITMGIMGIGMATFSFTAKGAPVSTKDASVSPMLSPTIPVTDIGILSPTPSDKPTTAPVTPTPTSIPANDLLCDAYPEINNLIQAYLTAKLDPLGSFDGILQNANSIDSELLQRKTEYIKNYHNVKCYTKNGINEIDFIVYVTYDIELAVIDTYSPSIDEFYVVLDENNKPLLYFGDISEETEKYFLETRNSGDVTALLSEIDTQLAEAIASDSALKEFYDKLVTSAEGSSN